MELDIKKSQTLLDSLVNSTPDMIWSVDPERFGLMTFNSSLYDYFLSSVGMQITSGMSPRKISFLLPRNIQNCGTHSTARL